MAVRGTVGLVCDRTLEPFDHPIRADKKLVFKYGDTDEELSDEIVLIHRDSESLELGQYIFEFIALEVPMKKLHPRFRDEEDEDDDEGEEIAGRIDGGRLYDLDCAVIVVGDGENAESSGAIGVDVTAVLDGDGTIVIDGRRHEVSDDYGVKVFHAWGMTEMSPLGTVGTLKEKQEKLGADARLAVQAKQGRGIFGVEMKIVDEEGKELPWDGKRFGNLMVRGPWIANGYFKGEGGDVLKDGWFPTGDVATIDPDGYMQITDRSKDVIKSGGEWISSIDLENIAVAHPAVAEAAVIGVKHPKWDERPIVVAVKKQGKEVSKEELLRFYEGKIAKWWMPDDVLFVPELPHTATGKLSKLTLRQQLKDYRLDSKPDR